MRRTENSELSNRSIEEIEKIEQLKEFHQQHIEYWGESWNQHSLVTMSRQTISRVIYYDMLYKQLLGISGCIVEFGVQWGATLAQLIALRGMYEPYNHRRHIYGFDTFSGFENTSERNDGHHVKEGDYRVYHGYEHELKNILRIHEQAAPISHIEKFSLIKGDASKTAKDWVNDNPHAIIAMAIFDMDIYQPTKDALEAILPRLTKGSILVFDELNCPKFPGETKAVSEVIGLNKIKLRHFPHQPNCAWAIWGE